MLKFRHKLYPQPLIYTNHGPAIFASHEFETGDMNIAHELARNPDIELIEGELPEATPAKKRSAKPSKATS